MIETTLHVTGMSCGNCVRHVREALSQLPGVDRVEVVLAEARALVVHDPEAAPPARLIAAVEDAGYAAATDPASSA